MAENILYSGSESSEDEWYSLSDNSDVDREIAEELNVEMKEMSVEESGRKGGKCESCVREECPWSDEGPWFERYERERELYGRVAVFFCFLCKMFVCGQCSPKHQWHEGHKVEGEESERMEEQRERERKRREYIEKLFQSENETERTEKLFSSHAVICDRVHVKHELDQNNCAISGLCGLENKKWVVCDWNNHCIKIFKLGSHVLQRYIRFVGSDSTPCDVTEIHLKQNSTEPNLVSGSSFDISATARADQVKQCLIAVTLPLERQIMFIDLSKKPVRVQKTINTEEECYPIQFYDDKIFTVCREGRNSPCSVYIYSSDGDKLNKFDTGIYLYVPRLAVVSGRVYKTDMHNFDNHKVQCRNVEGQLISEIRMEGSGNRGISVDPDNNVYVCAWWHDKVYKLDADLTRYQSVLDQTTDDIENPDALCYYRDKLFISHWGPPSSRNFVTVVRLL